MTTLQRRSLAFAVFLVLMGAALRLARHFGWLPLPPNFAPVGAIAMFGAVYLPRRYAVIVPLALMMVADVIIGFDFWPITVAIYASFAVSSLLGWRLKRKVRWWTVTGASLFGSIFFFLVTNAAVWLFTDMYAPGLAGLGQSYLAGLPFFRHTILGDLTYNGLFFGLYQLVVLYFQRRMKATFVASHG